MAAIKTFLLSSTPLQRLLGALVIIMVFTGALYQFGLATQRKKILAETAAAADIQQQLSDRERVIQEMKKAVVAPISISDNTNQILSLKQNKLFTRESHERFISETLPQLAEEAGLTKFAEPGENKQLIQTVLIDLGKPHLFKAQRRTVTLKFNAHYTQLKDFLTALWRENMYIRVTSLDVNSIDFKDLLKVDMTLGLYSGEEH
jgi:hypothetical protein